MAKGMQVGQIKISKLSYTAARKAVQADPRYQEKLRELAKKGEDAFKEAIDSNSGSVKGQTAKEQEKAKSYFKNNVHGVVHKGRRIDFVVIGSFGNRSALYEAEHADIPKAINKMTGEQ